jgi:TolB-like protein
MQTVGKTRKNSECGARPRLYEFGPFCVDPARSLLLRSGEPVTLTPKAFEILVVLLEHRGDIVLKQDLIDSVWPDTCVEEGNLSRNISTLRKALGEAPGDHEYVVTVPRRGYRFVGRVHEARARSGCPAQPPIESIAVLPFMNLSADAEQEYFADGMTEALLTDLAQICALRVVSRTSVMRYKNTRSTLKQIARELDVDAVVEGSVLRAGHRARITVQLIQGQTDQHLWANTYEGDLADVLGLQGSIARSIAHEIQVALTPREQARLAAARVVNPAAYEAYLKGRHFLGQRTAAALKRSVAYFEEALRADPRDVLAHVALAQACAVIAAEGFQAPRTVVPKALRAVNAALALDADLGEAHATLALLKFHHEWDFVGARRRFRTALDLCPGDASTHHWYGLLLGFQRCFDESLHELRTARGLDPLAPIIRAALGLVDVFAGRYDEAIAAAQSALEIEVDCPQACAVLGLAHQGQGLHARAIADFQRYVSLSAGDSTALMRLGCACVGSGEVGRAEQILSRLQLRSDHDYVSPADIAALELALGRTQRALALLADGLGPCTPSYVTLAVDPAFARLRTNARFQVLLRRIGLPCEAVLA